MSKYGYSENDNKLLGLSTFGMTHIENKPITSLGLTFVKNAFDNCVVQSHTVQWNELIDLLKTHITTLRKDDTMMLIPATFKGVSDDYDPARRQDGTIKFRTDGRPHVRRCKENVDLVYMLPLDFDGGMTIEEAKERFKEYQYIGYTSSGHRTERKDYKDAFRILLPFSNPLTGKQYELRNNAFRKWVGDELDQSSADVSRGFYIPSYLHEHRNNGHQTWYNNGKLLDPHQFEEANEVVYEPPQIQSTGIKGGKELNGKILWDTLDAVALFKALGLYKRQSGTAHLVTCPWEDEHSTHTSGTAIWNGSLSRKAGFNCQHSHCKDRTMYSVTQKVKEEAGMGFLKQFYEIIPYKNDRENRLKDIAKEIQALKAHIKI